jgi:hypothetical protein
MTVYDDFFVYKNKMILISYRTYRSFVIHKVDRGNENAWIIFLKKYEKLRCLSFNY